MASLAPKPRAAGGNTQRGREKNHWCLGGKRKDTGEEIEKWEGEDQEGVMAQ